MDEMESDPIAEVAIQSNARPGFTHIHRGGKAIRGLFAREFVRNLLTVMTGTAIAQIITFACLPIITRLYTPADFGLLGSFATIVGIIATTATLQFAQAVVMPAKATKAARLFNVCLLASVAVTMMSFIVPFLPMDWLTGGKSLGRARWILWLVPCSVLFQGLQQALAAWHIRRKSFRHTASSQVVRSVTLAGGQIGAGLLSAGAGGLVCGNVLGDACAIVNLGLGLDRADRTLFRKQFSLRRLYVTAREYYDFPFYATPQAILNATSQGIPVLLLAHFYGLAVAGAYTLGIRLIQTPLNLLQAPLRQVLFQRLSEYGNAPHLWHRAFVRATLILLMLALLPAIFVFFVAPILVVAFAGPQWLQAGQFASWLVVWAAVGFCNVPAVLSATLLRLQKQLLIFDILLLGFRVAALTITGLWYGPVIAVAVFSLVGMVMNAFYILYVNHKLIGRRNADGTHHGA